MKHFYITAQCSQAYSVTGWHTEDVYATSRDNALNYFNNLRLRRPGWLAASIEGVVEAPGQR